MALVQGLTTAAKTAALTYLATGTLKMALYTSVADLNAATAGYTTAGEVVGGGYIEGGQTLTNVAVQYADGVAYLSFDNPVWTPASFTARGALIYNPDLGALALAVLDFGADKSATTTFTVQIPAATATSAIVRIA